METDGKLRQAIKTYIDTFHEVKGLVELITELPIMQEEGLLQYGNNRVLQSWRLTTKDIESLYHKLTHSTLVEDINNGIVEDFPDEETISRRMKHLKFSLNQADIFRIGDIDLAFGDNIPTTKILSEIMDYAEAYDYINTVWGIFREWNLIVDCLNKVVSEIEREFLTPHPDTSTEQEQTVKRSPILDDKDIVAAFNSVEQIGFMEYRDGYYYWMADNVLLAYLCNRISLYKDYSKQYRKGIGDLPNWTVFEGLFKAKGRKKDEWVEVNSQKLSDYQKAYMKTHDSFSPDGCNPIDDIIDKYINH